VIKTSNIVNANKGVFTARAMKRGSSGLHYWGRLKLLSMKEAAELPEAEVGVRLMRTHVCVR
jgi:hypothetical protein